MERVARSKVGLWSEYGLAAVRDKFWYMVNEGTGFAKRSTWWDAFFLVLSGRGDEGIAGFLIRLLMNFVFNFTIGMFGAFARSLSFSEFKSFQVALVRSRGPWFSLSFPSMLGPSPVCPSHACGRARTSLAAGCATKLQNCVASAQELWWGSSGRCGESCRCARAPTDQLTLTHAPLLTF